MDTYPGMGRWPDDGQVDLWQYPRNCDQFLSGGYGTCNYTGINNKNPSFNPQGYTFTLAGDGGQGFVNGPGTSARFNHPEDVAVDDQGSIFVADTNNHAIRKVTKKGVVTTVAGMGPKHKGFQDGPCDLATFAFPKGLDVRMEVIAGKQTTVIIVADTGNHRIRRIDYVSSTECVVRCLTGLCGNNTLSATDSINRASPLTGFADGSGLEARFSDPESVAFIRGDYLAVADTGNFLIRWVHSGNGSTQTLAGSLVPGEMDPDGNPLSGCTPPCLRGQAGFRDGNLSFAQFYNPLDVTRGPNHTIYVADEQRIRIVELPATDSVIYSIHSTARVSTLAGTALQGHEDGLADKSSLFYSSGVFVTADNIAYVADSMSCRIRRISPMPLVAQLLTCSTRAFDIVRPSGCTSFDQPIDAIGRKGSRVEANVQYNIGSPYLPYPDQGKYIKNCVGVPPRDKLDKHFIAAGDNLVIDDDRVTVNEDSEQGTSIIVRCPSGCMDQKQYQVAGNEWYSDSSSVCRAAIHDGRITNAGGIVQILLERRDFLEGLATNVSSTREKCKMVIGPPPANITSQVCHNITVSLVSVDYTLGLTRNNITSVLMSDANQTVHRVFSSLPYNVSNSMVHTVAGSPSAPLENSCGFADGQPSLTAKFSNPTGLAASFNSSLTDDIYLYIADSENNRIRALAATCTQICENGGSCVGPDTCHCDPGWEGMDCTKPICPFCGRNQVCVSPEQCACKPGFNGTDCATPMCQQHCQNRGTCSAPDTCSCRPGWFDTTCATPVCSQTCANGGNCIGGGNPKMECDCPNEWTGTDCRTPVCKQECKNGGKCVAPDTCACSPQYTNFDCSAPVCNQGYFQANVRETSVDNAGNRPENTTSLLAVPTYKNCDLQSWCNATNEFECDQTEMTYGVIRVPSGDSAYNITGRDSPPTQCMNIELPVVFKVPYQLVNADKTNTGNVRYSPNSPYQSNDANEWRGFLNFTAGHTGPWTYEADRQVAYVNWLNVSQGIYVCANKGTCVTPNICKCAPGWIGFDCRTPVCEQGYYKYNQSTYVMPVTDPHVLLFEPFMFEPYLNNASNKGTMFQTVNLRKQWCNSSLPLYNATWCALAHANISSQAYWGRLNGSYSNPDYKTHVEFYESDNVVLRHWNFINGSRYLFQDDTLPLPLQGGYMCSIRADTRWENETYVWEHPNYYSLYMDQRRQDDGQTYTFWNDFEWPPIHRKSRVLDQYAHNFSFANTNEGWRRYGIWNRTGNDWQFGVCVLEFNRNCSDVSKSHDLRSGRQQVYVQDTDLSFRPFVEYDDKRVVSRGRWKQATGACIDQVVRGCPNNGTCVDKNVCQCAAGWSGYDCRTPVCEQTCYHHGLCTNPDVCTCERGWSGYDCLIPICAQECQNGGLCVAPDTCQCKQWPNTFRDGRVAGGRPLFQDANGDPLNTGWTGYDCSIPICVQSEKFLLNVVADKSASSVAENKTASNLVTVMGGHGADAQLLCVDSSGKTLPRCPDFDEQVTSNDGTSFQTGCGWDPYDSGCCVAVDDTGNNLACYVCPDVDRQVTNSTFYCSADNIIADTGTIQEKDNLHKYVTNRNFRMCGTYHAPRSHVVYSPLDYGEAEYYRNVLSPTESSFNMNSNWTSNSFLCNVGEWVQGDYNDDAGLGDIIGAGSYVGLRNNRTVRINSPEGKTGEGLYQCYNKGTCIAPDKCTCTDGYEGDDCNTPLCRHLQPSGAVSSCLNGGICVSKDSCNCVQTTSVLYNVHAEAAKGTTGWTGTDCSMPMCVQGYFDPFCSDLPQAPGGEGCFRCANNGNCTAPDVCTCAAGWTGYDCRTPVCEVVADPLTRTQLNTVFEDKVIGFETDPCGVVPIYGMHGWHGTKYARGNCTQPNQCTCWCKTAYSIKSCKKTGKLCDGPWQDPMVKVRNLLLARGPDYTFGSGDCKFGYEGNVDATDHFTTCHQTIYVPTSTEENSIGLIVGFSVAAVFAFFFYRVAAARLKKRFLLAKIERRRSKRSSEESMMSGGQTSGSGIY
jgi:hypothetical protein